MATRQLVALSLTLASSAALAQKTITTVEVRAETAESLTVSCDHPAQPGLKDVERVLVINDPSQTAALRTKLMSAAADACKAGVAKIKVERGANGKSLTWKAAQ